MHIIYNPTYSINIENLKEVTDIHENMRTDMMSHHSLTKKKDKVENIDLKLKNEFNGVS